MPSSTNSVSFSTPPHALVSFTCALFSNLSTFPSSIPFQTLFAFLGPMYVYFPSSCILFSQHVPSSTISVPFSTPPHARLSSTCPFQQFECPSTSDDAICSPLCPSQPSFALLSPMCISHSSECILFSPHVSSSTISVPFSTAPYALLSYTCVLSSNLGAFLTPRMPFSVHVRPSQPMRLAPPYKCLCQSQHAVLDHQCGHVWREHGVRSWRLAWGRRKSMRQGHGTRARNKGAGHEQMSMHGASGQGKDTGGQEQGTGAWDKGTRNGHG